MPSLTNNGGAQALICFVPSGSTTLFGSVKSCAKQVVAMVVDLNLEMILAIHSLDKRMLLA